MAKIKKIIKDVMASKNRLISKFIVPPGNRIHKKAIISIGYCKCNKTLPLKNNQLSTMSQVLEKIKKYAVDIFIRLYYDQRH
jgi:hypothetical protein